MESISESQRLILNQIDHACRELRPFEDRCYLECRFNDQITTIFGKAKLLGLPISREYGDGQGVDPLTYALIMERIGEEGTPVRTFFSGHISLGQLSIEKWGNKEQKSRYLPKTTRGEIITAFAVTEPTAGSDPASLKTNFKKLGNHYVLNGKKAWISNGTISDAVVTFAYPKGKREGMCAFIVDSDSEGFSTNQHKHKMGMLSADTGMISYDDCVIPKENLLGPVGKGLNVAYSAIMNGRLSVAAGCVGVMKDCLREVIKYAKTRVQHGKKIGQHQLVQRHIAIISSNLEAAKVLVQRAALMKAKLDSTSDNKNLRMNVDAIITNAKYFASNAAYDTADRAVQIFGANGYSFENRVARHLCDVRVCRIYEGTDEVLQLKIASHLLGKGFNAYS